jgi:hypothetical protein
MPHDIRPLTVADLPELSRFLTAGFHAPPDAPFAAVDVLQWKYFDPRGAEAGAAPRSYLARDPATGEVVGHVGACPGRWHGPGLPAEGVSTVHMIDWLSSQAGAGVGALLMRRVHQTCATQFGFGGSASGRGVIDRGGYGLVRMVPVYQRVLRPGHRLRVPGQGLAGRLLRAGKDVARLIRPSRRPRGTVELRPVAAFGDEVEPALAELAGQAVFTTRAPELLNHVLRYPRGGLSGWHVLHAGALRGFAVLAVVPQPGGVRAGRVVESLLDRDDADLRHAAAVALTRELKRQGADLAQAFASTDRAAQAWRAAGYAPLHALEFRLRDRPGRLPPGAAFHLTPLEADYAYT